MSRSRAGSTAAVFLRDEVSVICVGRSLAAEPFGRLMTLKPPHEFIALMDAARRQMADDYARIRRRASEDPGTAGDQAEETWAEFFRAWFPANYHVVTKGRLLDEEGRASPQVDVLILHPSYPRALTHQKLFLAGGVVAVFEVKLTLRTKALREFFSRSVQFKRQLRPAYGTLFDELHHRPIVGLLAHSHGWRHEDGHELLARIQQVETEFCESPRDLPDLIAVADTATVVLGSTTVFGPKADAACLDPNIVAEVRASSPDGAIAMTYYSQEDRGLIRNDTGLALAELLRSLVERTAMQDPSLQPFAQYLADIGSRGGIGLPTFWNPDVLSEEVRHRLRTVGYDENKWSKWHTSF